MSHFLSKSWHLFAAWFLNIFKTKKLKLFGWILSYALPVAYLIHYGVKANVTQAIKIQLWAMPIIAIVVVIYYKKIRKLLFRKQIVSEIRGTLLNPVWILLDTIMKVGILYALYYAFNIIKSINDSVQTYLVFCIGCIGLGGICFIADSINKLPISGGTSDE